MDISKKKNSKQCVICNKTYNRLDFLSTFDRMVTCGNVICTGRRQQQRYQIRLAKYKLRRDAKINDEDL